MPQFKSRFFTRKTKRPDPNPNPNPNPNLTVDSMDGTRTPRPRPRLERRNAAKNIEYDTSTTPRASSYSSSLDDSSSSSLVTRSLDMSNRTSFRIEGTEGELDRICRSLGLSGPEDFAIPAAAWEAMKMRSASDVLPSTSLIHDGPDSPKEEEEEEGGGEEETLKPNGVGDEQESELCARVLDSVRVSASKLTRPDPVDLAELNKCSGVSCGIKGARPPMLKPPPSMTLPAIDHASSTWDLLRDFDGKSDGVALPVFVSKDFSSDDEGEMKEDRRGGGKVGGCVGENKGEEEDERLLRAGESESYSFTTSNDDDSSSTTTEPLSNISPIGRFRRNITYWEKGELLGSGSFGSVYEGISE